MREEERVSKDYIYITISGVRIRRQPGDASIVDLMVRCVALELGRRPKIVADSPTGIP
jgi:hypothetical protein